MILRRRFGAATGINQMLRGTDGIRKYPKVNGGLLMQQQSVSG